MNRAIFLAMVLLLAAACSFAQQPSSDPNTSGQGSSGESSSGQSSSTQGSSGKSSAAAASSNKVSSSQADADREAEESSSRDARTDLSPPKDDAKNHPYSKSAVADLEPNPPADTTGVQEFRPWNPLKASRDVDVGDYYFKRKNYRAALERYKEALYYKDNDAIATYRLAVCQEKLGDKTEARKNFEQYLKILPEGPLAKDARASLEKLSEKKSP
jgi:tetratricopeptide (TPR) repeat protein